MCHYCKGNMDREFDPLSLPICQSCIFKKNPSLRNNPWYGEPDRIQKQLTKIELLKFDPTVIEESKRVGKVSKMSVQLEQCNPLETDNCVRFDLLMEHKVKPGFDPVLIEGLDVQLSNRDEIDILRKRLTRGYSAYLYYLAYGEKPRAIVSRKVTDVDFVTARNTSGANSSVYNQTIRRKLNKWNSEYSCNVVGASFDTLVVRFDKIQNKDDLKSLLDEIGKFCPDVKMSTDWRNEIGDKLRSGVPISLWWD